MTVLIVIEGALDTSGITIPKVIPHPYDMMTSLKSKIKNKHSFNKNGK